MKKNVDWKKELVPFYSILTSAFTSLILDAPDMSLETFLTLAVDLICNKMIQDKIRTQSESIENQEDQQDKEDNNTNEIELETEEESKDQETVKGLKLDPLLDKDGILVEKFNKHLIFFWILMNNPDDIEATQIIPELSKEVQKYSLKTHQVLKKSTSPFPATFHPHQDILNTSKLSEAISAFSA